MATYAHIHEHVFHMAVNILKIPWQDSVIGKWINNHSPAPE